MFTCELCGEESGNVALAVDHWSQNHDSDDHDPGCEMKGCEC